MNMKTPFLRTTLSITTVILVSVVLYYGIVFDGQLPDYRRWSYGKNDLALHALAFFTLSLPVLALWPRVLSVICLACLAGAIEIAQLWIPRRNPGLDDVFAGLAGVILGVAVLWILNRALCRVRAARGDPSVVLPVGQNAPLEDGEDSYSADR